MLSEDLNLEISEREIGPVTVAVTLLLRLSLASQL